MPWIACNLWFACSAVGVPVGVSNYVLWRPIRLKSGSWVAGSYKIEKLGTSVVRAGVSNLLIKDFQDNVNPSARGLGYLSQSSSRPLITATNSGMFYHT